MCMMKSECTWLTLRYRYISKWYSLLRAKVAEKMISLDKTKKTSQSKEQRFWSDICNNYRSRALGCIVFFFHNFLHWNRNLLKLSLGSLEKKVGALNFVKLHNKLFASASGWPLSQAHLMRKDEHSGHLVSSLYRRNVENSEKRRASAQHHPSNTCLPLALAILKT